MASYENEDGVFLKINPYFLLVFNYNFHRILHRFRDMAVFHKPEVTSSRFRKQDGVGRKQERRILKECPRLPISDLLWIFWYLLRFLRYINFSYQRGLSIRGVGEIWGFLGPYSLKFCFLSTRPPKGTSLAQNRSFDVSFMYIAQFVWPVEALMEKKERKKTEI